MRPSAAPGPVPNGRPPRCLVVDSSSKVIAQIHGVLQRVTPAAILLPPARDGKEALRRVRDYLPDILFLDLDAPRMGGLTTLRALEGMRPTRTAVLSPRTLEGGRGAWDALALGADDFLPKRFVHGTQAIDLSAVDLETRLRSLLRPLVPLRGGAGAVLRTRRMRPGDLEPLSAMVAFVETQRLLPAARLLARRCPEMPIPVLLEVPHPSRFSRAFCEGIDRIARCPVRIAAPGERLAPGQLFLVPGEQQVSLSGGRGNVRLELSPVKPQADSLAERQGMLRDLLAHDGTGPGILIAGIPPMELAGWMRRAARAGRLFLLRPKRAGRSTGLPLRTVSRLFTRNPRLAA